MTSPGAGTPTTTLPLRREKVSGMDYNALALAMHSEHRGKIEIRGKVPVRSRDDLSTAYTPGVAEPCRRIAADPDAVWEYTTKGNMVAVVTDGTAVLGLGDIGPFGRAARHGGQGLLFREFAGVDAVPLCLDTKDPDEIVARGEGRRAHVRRHKPSRTSPRPAALR